MIRLIYFFLSISIYDVRAFNNTEKFINRHINQFCISDAALKK